MKPLDKKVAKMFEKKGCTITPAKVGFLAEGVSNDYRVFCYYKSHATFTRITHRDEHGLPMAEFDRFWNWRKVNAGPIIIVIQVGNDILAANYDHLSVDLRPYWLEMNKTVGMYFFPQTALRPVGDVIDETIRAKRTVVWLEEPANLRK